MENQRESFIFYRSFFEAIEDLPDNNKLEIYKAIGEYSLDFKESKLTGISKTIFTLIKPQLDANNKRYTNGCKPKTKLTGSKEEAKPKQDASKTEANVNDNVNPNVNVNENNKEVSIVETKVSHKLKYLMLDTLNKESFVNEYNSSEDIIKKEMMKFYLYWSEKKPNGKKELWEMQKTFDVRRRFHKWLDNNSKWNKNTEEEERNIKLAELQKKKDLLFNQRKNEL